MALNRDTEGKQQKRGTHCTIMRDLGAYMLTKIIAQLKTGNIKNVVAFSCNHASNSYVVKPAMDPLGRGRLISFPGELVP